nr:hypothetical protein [uncultured Bacteroides sp.]
MLPRSIQKAFQCKPEQVCQKRRRTDQ